MACKAAYECQTLSIIKPCICLISRLFIHHRQCEDIVFMNERASHSICLKYPRVKIGFQTEELLGAKFELPPMHATEQKTTQHNKHDTRPSSTLAPIRRFHGQMNVKQALIMYDLIGN